MAYTVRDLKDDIAKLPDDEEITVVVQLEPGDDPMEVSDGDVLQINEAGGFVRGMRVIYASPRS